jgi:hypothetical protein
VGSGAALHVIHFHKPPADCAIRSRRNRRNEANYPRLRVCAGRDHGLIATPCPPDYRIAGEVQAIGGKWMKMGEKEVVTGKWREAKSCWVA